MFLIISPATFEQVKSNAEPDTYVYTIVVTVFPCVGLYAGAILPKLFRQN